MGRESVGKERKEMEKTGRKTRERTADTWGVGTHL